jgi:hypothetical protein
VLHHTSGTVATDPGPAGNILLVALAGVIIWLLLPDDLAHAHPQARDRLLLGGQGHGLEHAGPSRPSRSPAHGHRHESRAVALKARSNEPMKRKTKG